MSYDPISELLRAIGLTAKFEVIRRHAETLLSDQTIAVFEQLVAADPADKDDLGVHLKILSTVREDGAEGIKRSGEWLLRHWMETDAFDRKVAFLTRWQDPLLGKPVFDRLTAWWEEQIDAEVHAFLGWHRELILQCMELGVAAGAEAHRNVAGAQPPGRMTTSVDLQALYAEWDDLLGAEDHDSLIRRIGLGEQILEILPDDPSNDVLYEVKADILSQLGSDLLLSIQAGLASPGDHARVAERAHALLGDALEIYRRLEHWVGVAMTALNKAGLFLRAYEAGEGSAAAKAHALYDEALEIYRRLEQWTEVAASAQNEALLFTREYEAGEGSAAAKAHALYDEALEIYRHLEHWVGVAASGNNKALLLASEYSLGHRSAAARAHALYDEALEIRRRLERWVEVAHSAHNKAVLLASEYYGAGEGFAAAKAHALFDEALEIYRRLELWVDMAATVRAKADLLTREYEAGDGSAAAKAHALYDEALGVSRQLKRWVDVAGTAQNKAMLFAADYAAGDGAAAAKAHALYDEALEIYRRLEHWVGVATSAQNKAILFTEEYGAGDGSAAAKAHAHYDEALEIRRRLERWIEVAHTAHNKAGLLAREYAAGDGSAAAKAHALYDEALEIYRRLELRVDVADTALSKAILFTEEYQANDRSTAAKAHALYDEALEISRFLNRSVSVATSLQNNALLYSREYEAGERSASAKAHMLYDEALKIYRRLEHWVGVATSARDQAGLLAREYVAGDVSAAAKAHALYGEALKILPEGAPTNTRLQILRSTLRLVVSESRPGPVVALAEVILALSRTGIGEIPDGAWRDKLLTHVSGVGRIGAAAATALDGGDVDLAIRLLERGRTQQLNARLREREADLSEDDRERLDDARSSLDRAEQVQGRLAEALSESIRAGVGREEVQEIRKALEIAEKDLRAIHERMATLKVELGLDDLDPPVPTPAELRERLGAATLVLPWYGREGGGFFLLGTSDSTWRDLRLPHLTEAAVNNTVNRHLKIEREISESFDANRPATDARGVQADAALNDLCARCAEDPGVMGLWDLIGGPLSEALEEIGVSPAGADDEDAPEIVLCPTPELAILPLAAARPVADADDWFLDRYALRQVPSLGVAMTTANWAKAWEADRPADPSAVLVTDPLSDLGVMESPVSRSFSGDRCTALTGYLGERLPGGERLQIPPERVATWTVMRESIERVRPDFFVFYGHSHWVGVNARQSAICLAQPLDEKGNRPTEETGRGLRTAMDLVGPDLLHQLSLGKTRLAASFSCSSGLAGLFRAPDEFVGLTSSYLEAGAAGVLASLWTVEASATAELAADAIDQIVKGGIAPVQALRRAQINLRKDIRQRQAGLDAAAPESGELPLDASQFVRAPADPTLPRSGLTQHVAAFILVGA